MSLASSFCKISGRYESLSFSKKNKVRHYIVKACDKMVYSACTTKITSIWPSEGLKTRIALKFSKPALTNVGHAYQSRLPEICPGDIDVCMRATTWGGCSVCPTNSKSHYFCDIRIVSPYLSTVTSVYLTSNHFS